MLFKALSVLVQAVHGSPDVDVWRHLSLMLSWQLWLQWLAWWGLCRESYCTLTSLCLVSLLSRGAHLIVLDLMSLCGNPATKFPLGKCFARRVRVSSLPCGASLQFVSTVHGGTKLSGGRRYGCTSVMMVQKTPPSCQTWHALKRCFSWLFNMAPFLF